MKLREKHICTYLITIKKRKSPYWYWRGGNMIIDRGEFLPNDIYIRRIISSTT